MSSNYSAQQFNDAFIPRRLGNWEIPAARDYEQRPSRPFNCYSTPFLSDAKGRFLPEVKAHIVKMKQRQEHQMQNQLLSSWNQLCQIWFSTGGCNCSKKMRRLEEQDYDTFEPRIQVPSFFRQTRKKRRRPIRPKTPTKKVDPYLNYLREKQLPTIWVLGVPTQSIKGRRKHIAKQIAEELNYTYIDLEEQIGNWIRRQREEEGRNLPQTTKSELFNTEKVHYPSVFAITPSYRSLKHKNSSLMEVESVDQFETTKMTELKPTKEQMNIPHFIFQETQNANTEFAEYCIDFNTSEKFTTEQVLNLVKFAMVEALPTKGFLLDGFPCNLEEAHEFERSFYPTALVLYFVARHGPDLCKSPMSSTTRNKKTSKEDPEKEDNLVHPKRFRRKYQFTKEGAEAICSRRNYGRKVIRVLDTQRVDKDTMDFIHQVIQDNLENYANIFTGRECVELVGYDVESPEEYVAGSRSSSPVESTQNCPLNQESDLTLNGCNNDMHQQDSSKLPQRLPPLVNCSSSRSSEEFTTIVAAKALPVVTSESSTSALVFHAFGASSGENDEKETAKSTSLSKVSITSVSTIFRTTEKQRIETEKEAVDSTVTSNSRQSPRQKFLIDPDERPLPMTGFNQELILVDTPEIGDTTQAPETSKKIDDGIKAGGDGDNQTLNAEKEPEPEMPSVQQHEEGIDSIECLCEWFESSTDDDFLGDGASAFVNPISKKDESEPEEQKRKRGEDGDGL